MEGWGRKILGKNIGGYTQLGWFKNNFQWGNAYHLRDDGTKYKDGWAKVSIWSSF